MLTDYTRNPCAKVDPYTGAALNYGAMVQQIASMAIGQYERDIGTMNAFGDPLTAADLAAALREIARVATAFAERIERADFATHYPDGMGLSES